MEAASNSTEKRKQERTKENTGGKEDEKWREAPGKMRGRAESGAQHDSVLVCCLVQTPLTSMQRDESTGAAVQDITQWPD